jgi:hypothetical protein
MLLLSLLPFIVVVFFLKPPVVIGRGPFLVVANDIKSAAAERNP